MILINAREKCPVEAGQTISVAGPVYFSILFLQLLEITFNLLLLSRKLTPKRDYLMKKGRKLCGLLIVSAVFRQEEC